MLQYYRIYFCALETKSYDRKPEISNEVSIYNQCMSNRTRWSYLLLLQSAKHIPTWDYLLQCVLSLYRSHFPCRNPKLWIFWIFYCVFTFFLLIPFISYFFLYVDLPEFFTFYLKFISFPQTFWDFMHYSPHRYKTNVFRPFIVDFCLGLPILITQKIKAAP